MNFNNYLYGLKDSEYVNFARKFDLRKLCVEKDGFDNDPIIIEMFDVDFNLKEVPDYLIRFIKYESISKNGVLRPFIEAEFNSMLEKTIKEIN